MSVLSIDLASKDYTEFGFCLLRDGSHHLEILGPKDLGLASTPSPRALAGTLAGFCGEHAVSVLLIDGPQGWRWPQSPISHMRLCERVLNTPARTGAPGMVKPSTYLTFVQFSIDLFHHLRSEHGWSLLVEDWPVLPGRLWLVETFPSAAWRLLGLPRLPGKHKAKGMDLSPWREGLSRVTGLEFRGKVGHDQLQAAVASQAGWAIARGERKRVVLAGMDPLVTAEDVVYEGWIALPCVPEP